MRTELNVVTREIRVVDLDHPREDGWWELADQMEELEDVSLGPIANHVRTMGYETTVDASALTNAALVRNYNGNAWVDVDSDDGMYFRNDSLISTTISDSRLNTHTILKDGRRGEIPKTIWNLNQAESIFAFVTWLTGIKGEVTTGEGHEPDAMVKLLVKFLEANNCPTTVRHDYPDYYQMPSQDLEELGVVFRKKSPTGFFTMRDNLTNSQYVSEMYSGGMTPVFPDPFE